MLLSILDGNGIPQTVLTAGQESQVDYSGTILATGVSQILLPANPLRSGWIIQNRSSNIMHVNDLGAASSLGGSFGVSTNGLFPPANFPVSPDAISIVGTVGDVFTVREW